MDIDKLIYALDNDSNENIIHLTTIKMMEMNLNILNELHLKPTIDGIKQFSWFNFLFGN